jgi:uncharacterized lipoprotein YehR (DUF1307 family)
MNKKILLAVLAIALVLGMTLAGCKEKDEENLDGTWTKDGHTITVSGNNITITASGGSSLNGTVSYGGGTMTSTVAGETSTFNYSLSGNKLTISSAEPMGPITFNGVWTKS